MHSQLPHARNALPKLQKLHMPYSFEAIFIRCHIHLRPCHGHQGQGDALNLTNATTQRAPKQICGNYAQHYAGTMPPPLSATVTPTATHVAVAVVAAPHVVDSTSLASVVIAGILLFSALCLPVVILLYAKTQRENEVRRRIEQRKAVYATSMCSPRSQESGRELMDAAPVARRSASLGVPCSPSPLPGRSVFFFLARAGRSLRDPPLFLFAKDRPQGPTPGTTDRQPSTATNRQPPPTANRQLPTPPTTNRQPPTAANRHQLPTANRYQPPTTNHQPLGNAQNNRSAAVGYRQTTLGCSPIAFSYRPTALGCPPTAGGHRPSAASHCQNMAECVLLSSFLLFFFVLVCFQTKTSLAAYML